jgi:hypothetical protein
LPGITGCGMGGMQSLKNPSWEISGMKFKFRSFRNIFPSLISIKLCGRQATHSPFGHLEPAVRRRKNCVVKFLQTLFSCLFSFKKIGSVLIFVNFVSSRHFCRFIFGRRRWVHLDVTLARPLILSLVLFPYALQHVTVTHPAMKIND